MEFAMSKKIKLTAEFLPGRLNVRAGQAFTNFQYSREWLLSPRVFPEICVKWGFPELDLFASRAYHQTPSYLSWKAVHTAQQQMHPNLESSIKGQSRGGGCNSNKTNLARTTLAQSVSRIICNRTSAFTSVKQHLGESSRSSTPSCCEPHSKTSGLESVRQSVTSEGISGRAAELTAGARRPGASFNYN